MPSVATSNAKMSTRALLGYGACALAGCLWGTGFFFGKIALAEMSGGHMVLYRFLFACPPLFFLLRRPGFTRRDWSLLLLASFLGIPVQYLMQFQGLSMTTVSHAALMVGTMPVIRPSAIVMSTAEWICAGSSESRGTAPRIADTSLTKDSRAPPA